MQRKDSMVMRKVVEVARPVYDGCRGEGGAGPVLLWSPEGGGGYITQGYITPPSLQLRPKFQGTKPRDEFDSGASLKALSFWMARLVSGRDPLWATTHCGPRPALGREPLEGPPLWQGKQPVTAPGHHYCKQPQCKAQCKRAASGTGWSLCLYPAIKV